MNKKGFAPLLILAVLLVAGFAFLIATDRVSVGNVFGVDYSAVYKANYGHACCIAGPDETLAGPRYADDVTETACSENVDSCSVILTNKRPSSFFDVTAYWKTCNIDGSSCSGLSSQRITRGSTYSFSLPAGKKVVFVNALLSVDDRNWYTWERRGAPYSIISQENGKIFSSNATAGCYISDDIKDQVVAESPNPIPKGWQYCQNYLIDFIEVATQTYQYNSQEVVCQARGIYGIIYQKMEDNRTVKIQRNQIATVDCCPSEPNCNQNFKFVTNNVRSCTYSTQCPNAGDPIPVSQTKARYFVCEAGQCVEKQKSVECTSNAVCQQRHGEGFLCNLAPNSYGICGKAVGGVFCGDGYCDIGESKSSCPVDCNIECKEGEKLVTETTKVNCLIDVGPIQAGFCDTQTEQVCKDAGLNWYKIIVFSLLAIVLLFVLIRFFGPIARFFGKIFSLIPGVVLIALFFNPIFWIALVVIVLLIVVGVWLI